eukprot:TRINITY_DN128_c0_g2_i3.p1 TRINITY_DN128_c0_g2~~TRINITY_DN128_c0_g2_i3.p1  ORF type:complete len:121 (+),score=25.08 TRINITY_DN128_c0_g2_i3:86-448(+)
MSDRLGFRKLAVGVYIAGIIAPFLLVKFASFLGIFYVSSMVGFLILGSSGSLFPYELARVFGPTIGSTLSGILNTGNVVAFACLVVIIKLLLNQILYSGILALICGVVCVSLLLTLTIRT